MRLAGSSAYARHMQTLIEILIVLSIISFMFMANINLLGKIYSHATKLSQQIENLQ